MLNDTPTVLRMDEVARYVRLGRTTIYRQIRKGRFPKPIHLTEKSRAWLKSDLDEWLQSLTGQQLPLPFDDEEGRP